MEMPAYFKMPSADVRKKCRDLVVEAAQRYAIPPAYVTAHIRIPAAVAARREVQRAMLAMGLTRSQLAGAFGCDLRRVRASVIGGPESEQAWTKRDFTRKDLFGNPIASEPRRPAPRPSLLQEALQMIQLLAPKNPEAAAWLKRHRLP